jgi:hypothetical protein
MTKEGRLKKDANNGGPYKMKWFVPCEAQFATWEILVQVALWLTSTSAFSKESWNVEFGEALLGMMLSLNGLSTIGVGTYLTQKQAIVWEEPNGTE